MQHHPKWICCTSRLSAASRIVSDLKDDWGKASNCTGCGKCGQACPTGALAEKGFSVMEMVKESDGVSRLARQKAALMGAR